jgi:hypothetical protein
MSQFTRSATTASFLALSLCAFAILGVFALKIQTVAPPISSPAGLLSPTFPFTPALLVLLRPAIILDLNLLTHLPQLVFPILPQVPTAKPVTSKPPTAAYGSTRQEHNSFEKTKNVSPPTSYTTHLLTYSPLTNSLPHLSAESQLTKSSREENVGLER